MKTNRFSGMDNVAVLLILVGTVMMVGGGFTERFDTQIGGLTMWVAGTLQLLHSRASRVENTFSV